MDSQTMVPGSVSQPIVFGPLLVHISPAGSSQKTPQKGNTDSHMGKQEHKKTREKYQQQINSKFNFEYSKLYFPYAVLHKKVWNSFFKSM